MPRNPFIGAPYYPDYTDYLKNKRCDNICKEIPVCPPKELDITNSAQNKKIIEGAKSNLYIGEYTFSANMLNTNKLILQAVKEDQIAVSNKEKQLVGYSDFTYKNNTLNLTNIGGFKAQGSIDFNSQEMKNVNITGGNIKGVTIQASVDYDLTDAQKKEIVTNKDIEAKILKINSIAKDHILLMGSDGLVIGEPRLSYSNNNLIIDSNVDFSGKTQQNMNLKNPILNINKDISLNQTDSGILIERGANNNNAFIGWKEKEDKFILGTTPQKNLLNNEINVNKGILIADINGNADTANTLKSFVKIGGVDFDGSKDIILPGVNTTGEVNTTGSAAKLTNSRRIGNIPFDGTSDIDPEKISINETIYDNCYIALFEKNTGIVQPKTNNGLIYNASNKTLTTNNFIGNLDGEIGSTKPNIITGTTITANTKLISGTTELGKNATKTTIDGQLIIEGKTSINNDVIISDNKSFSVGNGDSIFNGSLKVFGITNFENDISISNSKKLNVGTGKTTLGGTLEVNGQTNLNDHVTIADNKFLKVKSGPSIFGGGITVTGNSSITGDLTISGNINGAASTTTIDTTHLLIKDNIILINKGIQSNQNNCGILIERGSTGDNAFIGWDESDDKFILGTTNQNSLSTSNINIDVGTLKASLNGNSDTATKLQTHRNIGGVSFDGSQDIDLKGVNQMGNQDTSGNAATATKLQTPININGVSFDGSQNISIPGISHDGVAHNANKLNQAVKIGGVSFDGSQDIDLPGVNETGNQNTSGNAATATKLQTPRNIGGISFDGSQDMDLPGVNETGNQNTSGNASTATKLQTPRNIGGVSFDGSQDIALPGVNESGTQNTSGNAATATKLQTPRTIGGISFDGSQDISLPGVDKEGEQNTTGNAATATKIATIDNSNIVLLNDTQTLKNKKINNPTIEGNTGEANRLVIKDSELNHNINIQVSDIILSGDQNIILPSSDGTLALKSDIPTNNNQLTNGSGYITDSSSDTLKNKNLKSPTITGTSGDTNRLVIQDSDLTNNIYIQVPNLSGDQNIMLPSSGGTLALTSDLTDIVKLTTSQTLSNKTFHTPIDGNPTKFTGGFDMYFYRTSGNTLTSTDIGGTIKGDGKVLYESGVSDYNLGPHLIKEDFAVNLCANFNGAIYCNSAIYVGCDKRNKHKITEINDSKALDILRKINVYTFYYNDVFNKPHNLHYNVLAQEVEKILPQAISKEKGFLANIMKQVKVKFIAIENNEFKMIVETEIEEIETDKNFRFYCYYGEKKSDIIDLTCIENNNTFIVNKEYDYVICYGSESMVLSVDTQVIYSLCHSGIQEIDRQQLVDKTRITNLETKVNKLETENIQHQDKITNLENDNNILKDRINQIESLLIKHNIN